MRSVKNVFLERFLRNSQEKACVRDYFKKVAFLRLQKRDSGTSAFL